MAEDLLPNLLDDITCSILQRLPPQALIKFMITCKRCHKPEVVIPCIREASVNSLTTNSTDKSWWPLVQQLDTVDVEPVGITFQGKESIKLPSNIRHAYFWFDKYHTPMIDILHEVKSLEIFAVEGECHELMHNLGKVKWSNLVELSINIEGHRWIFSTDAFECNMPKLKRLNLNCVCCFPVVRQPVWNQLEFCKVHHVCKNCAKWFCGAEVTKLVFSMITCQQWHEDGTRELLSTSPAYQDVYETYGLALKLTKIAAPSNFPAETNAKFLPKALEIIGNGIQRFHKEAVLDAISSMDCSNLRLLIPAVWVKFSLKKTWIEALLQNRAFMQSGLRTELASFVDVVSAARRAGIPDPWTRQCIRTAFYGMEEWKIQPALVTFLHHQWDIHDLCGVLYHTVKTDSVFLWFAQLQHDFKSLCTWDFESLRKASGLIRSKLEHFEKITLPKKMRGYYCEFCTTCKYI